MFIMHGRPFIWFPGWGKVISAQVCAEDVLLALIMTWTPVSAVSLLSPPACRLLTAKHVWIKQNQRDFNADIIGNELFTLQPFLSPSLIFCFFFFTLTVAAAPGLWVKPGDQAPTTASAEATERGEEEQTADQHCRYSGSRGNENKGTERTIYKLYCDSLNWIQQLQGNHLSRSKLLFPPSLIRENVVGTTVQSTSSPGAWILLLHNSIVKLLITEQYTSCLATNPNCNCVSIPYSRVFIFKQVSQPFLDADWDTKLV